MGGDATGDRALLDTISVGDHLRRRGLLDGRPWIARVLAGGVSNVVIEVRQGGRALVVKQSLERLRVAANWHAPRDRMLAEAAGLAECARRTPGAVPAVVDLDEEKLVLVLQRSPDDWTDWKTALLTSTTDEVDRHAAVGRRLGAILAAWHAPTVVLPPAVEKAASAFEALRLRPYHEAVAVARPDLADAVRAVADGLRAHRRTFVHGDLSPKNVLVGELDDVWVIDFEVAHRGDPVFDVAFLLTHLTLKALHRPTAAVVPDGASRAFWAAYTAGAPAPAPRTLAANVGCLLLARVFGMSPAEYLSPGQAALAARLGEQLLRSELDGADDLIHTRIDLTGEESS